MGGRAVVVGKLSGLLMRHWTVASTAEQVRHLLAALPDSVRVLIADQHGEIPPSVPLEVLAAAADALRRYGRYPLGARRA